MPAAGGHPPRTGGGRRAQAVGANPLGWKIQAELGADGALVVAWTAPRPILEVKMGVGFTIPTIPGSTADGITPKSRNRSNDPQPMGCIPFPIA